MMFYLKGDLQPTVHVSVWKKCLRLIGHLQVEHVFMKLTSCSLVAESSEAEM